MWTHMSRDCADTAPHTKPHCTKHYKWRRTSCTCTGKCGAKRSLKISACVCLRADCGDSVHVYLFPGVFISPYVCACVFPFFRVTVFWLRIHDVSVVVYEKCTHHTQYTQHYCVHPHPVVLAQCGQTEPWMRNTYVLPHLKHPSSYPLPMYTIQWWSITVWYWTLTKPVVCCGPWWVGWLSKTLLWMRTVCTEPEPSWDDSFMDCTDETWDALKHEAVTSVGFTHRHTVDVDTHQPK